MLERWPMSEAIRNAVVRELSRILIDSNASRREKTSAARALIAADAQNIEQEKMSKNEEYEYRAKLVELVKHIPVGDVVRIAAERGINIGSEIRQDGIPTTVDGETEEGPARHNDTNSV